MIRLNSYSTYQKQSLNKQKIAFGIKEILDPRAYKPPFMSSYTPPPERTRFQRLFDRIKDYLLN